MSPLGLVLLLLAFILPQPIITPILSDRGEAHEIFDNQDRSFQYRTAEKWVFNGTDFVPYLFENAFLEKGYYQVEVGLLKARIYADHASFYGENFTDIRLHDERFDIQMKVADSNPATDYRPIGAQAGGALFEIDQTPERLNITKILTSRTGILTITYQFLDHLKHSIEFCSSEKSEERFKLVQSHRGIVADKVRHQNATVSILRDILNATEIESASFRFEKDGKLSLRENQAASLSVLEDVKLDIHSKGLQASYIFGDFALESGECFTIDPDTFTDDSPTFDAYVRTADDSAGGSACPGSPFTIQSGDHVEINVQAQGSNRLCRRAAFEWDISPIAAGSTVQNVTFGYEVGHQSGARNCDYNEMNTQPSIASASALWTDIGDGTTFVSDDSICTTVGANKLVILGSDAHADVEAQISAGWWGLGVKANNEVRDGSQHQILIEDQTHSPVPVPPPELTVRTSASIRKSAASDSVST